MTAFETLVSRHERRIYGLARRITGSVEDAQDVTQQTFISSLRNLSRFRESSTFSTWLVTIATHAALKVVRKRRGIPTQSLDEATTPDDTGQIPHPEFIADWRETPDQLLQRAETRQLLDTAIARLDPGHRAVFLLRDVEDLSVREAAKTLRISEANVKVRLLRARLHLRESLTRALGDAAHRYEPAGHAHALPPATREIHGVDALGCLCAGPYFDSIVAETAQKLPDLRMVHWRLVADTREKSRQAVEGLGALVGLIAALLGAIAVWAAVTGELRERRSEIGVLSAMGAGGGRIFLLFLPKVALVGIMGGALGWGAGTVLAVWAGPALAGLGPDVPVLALTSLLPWAVVSGLLLALAAGGAAIWRAVRIDPVDALREL